MGQPRKVKTSTTKRTDKMKAHKQFQAKVIRQEFEASSQSVGSTVFVHDCVQKLNTMVGDFRKKAEADPVKAMDELMKKNSSDRLQDAVDLLSDLTAKGHTCDKKLEALALLLFGKPSEELLDITKSIDACTKSVQSAFKWAYTAAAGNDHKFNMGAVKTLLMVAKGVAEGRESGQPADVEMRG